ncbi:MAG: ADP-ribosylglycohydrolase family protein [Rhodopseudomonas palustris]|nr:ADP-ribosylglycohydrolase family protein [Rhodopseudomonas palustris]
MTPASLEDRALAAYLGFAIGDALGATVEFMTKGEIAAQYGIHRDIIGGGWLKLKPGQITDDTEMATRARPARCCATTGWKPSMCARNSPPG